VSAGRRPGMDHALYDWSPIVRRPALTWPGGARLALWIVVYLEYWELDPPPDAHRPPGIHGTWPAHFPDYRTYSHRDYGNRVGIFRVMEVLDRCGLRATVAANAAACERYPFLVEECLRRGWELIGHGTHASRMITSRMTETEERQVIAHSLAALKAATGREPKGWLGQDFGESERTPRLLAEAGLTYLADWPNDDQPYLFGEDRSLVSIPYHLEWDDVQLLWLRNVAAPRYPTIVADAFDCLWRESQSGGRLFGIGVHPWLFGQAHRVRYLDEALRRICERDRIWKATGSEIAERFLSQSGRRNP